MKKKKLIIFGATVLSALGLAGCSTALEKAQTSLSDVSKNVLNENLNFRQRLEGGIEKYKFLGANFDGNSNGEFDIEICGVSVANETKEKAYTTLYYTIPATEFNGINAKDSTAVINSLTQVVPNYEIKDFSYAPVKDFNNLNGAVKSVLESPLDEYKTHSALVYGVDNLNFNYEDGYASFTTYEDTKYSRTRTELVWTVVGWDLEGNPQYGWAVQSVTDYEGFVQEHNMYVKASTEELDAMKEDNTLVFDKFVEAVKTGDKSLYTVQSVNVVKTTEFNTNLLGTDYSM